MKGLHHVNVEVSDVEVSRRFYALVGLKEIPRDGDAKRPGTWYELPDGKQLHLGQGKPGAGPWHFAILVDDLEELRAALSKSGAPIESGRPLPGYERFFTRDPDGNRIEILKKRGC